MALQNLINIQYAYCPIDFMNLRKFRACLHEGGGPRVGEVTRGGLPPPNM